MKWKMTMVARRFRDPKTNVPKEELACGHVRTDPALYYNNETAFKIRRALESIAPELPVKARCYKCAKEN
jgi:hypothetical protein